MLWYFQLYKKKKKKKKRKKSKKVFQQDTVFSPQRRVLMSQTGSRLGLWYTELILISNHGHDHKAGVQQGFTSFLVNLGEWSFLSSIMIVAVAVPVNPTSSPAISWASMINSYLGFSRVYKAKAQQRMTFRSGLSLGIGEMHVARADAVCPSPSRAGACHSTLTCCA